MTRFTKVLLSTLVVTVVAGTLGVGTFASFSAETDNGSTFKSGTIVLSNKVATGAVCLSTGAGVSTDTNVNAGCDALFALATQKPGGTVQTVDLTLKNEGTLDATGAVFASVCTPTDATGENYHGTGDICSVTDFYIQEYTDATRSTTSNCIYGGGTATDCAIASNKTLKTFATAYPSSGTPLGVGSLNAGASRYFRIGVQLDTTADNTMQGRQAAITFKWLASQV
jgi:hypothetical protein